MDHESFELLFAQQPFYTNLRFIHGDALFLRDGDAYRTLIVQVAYTMSNLHYDNHTVN